MAHVFISHVSENKEEVDRLAEDLRKHGVKVWLNRDDIKPGSRWQDAIREAIEEGDFFIACFSEEYHSRGKTYMNEELDLAIAELHQYPTGRAWFIPVLLSECEVPDLKISRAGETLQDLQWVALYEDWESGLQRILSVIKPHSKVDTEEVTTFIKLLRNDNADVRSHAADTLGKFGEPTAVQPLIEALNDVNERVRSHTVDALSQIGKPVKDIVPALMKALYDESEFVTYRAIVALEKIGERAKINESAPFLLDEGKNWLAKSYALRHLKGYRSSLLISDGTEFADELGAMAQVAGFRVINISTPMFFLPQPIMEIFDEMLKTYELVILVRGEHFSQYGNESFYSKLRHFVYKGGSLFATSWVSWETKYHHKFANILPFTYIRDTYNENVIVTCRPMECELARNLFPNQISYCTSFEPLQNRENSTVLFETDDGVPIFGYRRFGSGHCYYLNTCQHYCLGDMLSPLQTSLELNECIQRVFEWIYESGVDRDGVG